MERGGEYSGRKWTLLVVIVLIQAFSGMNSDFSSYSLKLKSVLGLSQVQLNYLSMASDFGKLFGWFPGLFLVCDEEWFALLFFAFLGFLGYGAQWLLINSIMSLPYFPVFLLCLLSSCCITWINMVSYVFCIRNFPSNRSLALSLGISFNGMSAAIYSLIDKAINPDDSSLYLVLNGVAPLIISIIGLTPILWQPPAALNIRSPPNLDNTWTFLWLYIAAAFIGLCLLFYDSMSLYAFEVTVFLVPVMTLLILIFKMNCCYDDDDDPWTRRSLAPPSIPIEDYVETTTTRERRSCGGFFIKDRLTRLGEEHSFKLLLRRWDFWLYYTAYLCSGTIGLAYCNSLGQIVHTLGFSSDISRLLTIYSACSFVGRLLAALPDFLQHKENHARTGWLSFAVFLTPGGLLLLFLLGNKTTLLVATALIGLSSGFVFSAAASLTWELFGVNNAGINHGILITNVPLGSFLYGILAAFFHEDNSKVCIGKKCYDRTLACWFFISVILGVGSSTMLYWRTRSAYHRRR